MIYNDRELMAELIGHKLEHLKSEELTIIAVPPKGIALGKTLAEHLNVNFEIARLNNISPNKNKSNENHLQEINELMTALFKLFNTKAKTDYNGKTVLIIDEGTITEDKIIPLIDNVKKLNAAKVIVIASGLSTYNANKLNKLADELYTFNLIDDADNIPLDQINFKDDVHQYLKKWWNNTNENLICYYN